MVASRIREFVGRFDWLLFAGMVLVVGIGLVTLYSIAIGRGGGDLYTFKKQVAVALGGLFLYGLFSFVHFHTWQSISRWLYVGMLVLLGATLAFGQVVNGTRGWLAVGALHFQPVELAKFVGVIVLASYFARRSRELDLFSNLVQSFLVAAFLAVLVFLQPDFGSAALLLSLWAGLVLVIGVKRKYLVAFAVTASVILVIGWMFLFKPYQKERIATFFSPEAVTSASYNVRQATIAVGSGQLFGRGLGEGSQSQLRFLPEAETDFIFAVIAEQLGFAGVAVLVGIIAMMYVRMFLLINRCHDWFAAFFVLGTIILFTVEIFINAGMSMGLVPVVGIPFPLVSAGGSSLLVHLALLGIVQNVARREGSRGYQMSRVATV
ncbi:MAG: FtsW/RodA/SpoVE family cell cycle protein [Patescibacteria group bacterium]|jgi:rod shape determining protein RodA